MTDLVLRYAETDADVVCIHGFLCITMGPMLPGPIDPTKSATEVWRVVNHEAAMMVMRQDKLIGTLGLIKPDFWWGNQNFLTNRWFSCLPGFGAGRLLLREADRFAKDVGLECFIYDEAKGRVTLLNKSPDRKDVNPYLVPLSAPQVSTTLQ
jgi:hypothetical protein